MLGSWTKPEQRFVLSVVIDPANTWVTNSTSDQLYTATLDNMGNNNTTCKTIQDIHTHRGLEWNSDGQQLPYVLLIYFYSSRLNFVVVAWDMLSTLGTLTLWATSRRLQLSKMRQLSGNTIPPELIIVLAAMDLGTDFLICARDQSKVDCGTHCQI
jgi:hypothetical protein